MKTAAPHSTCHTSLQIITAGRRRYRGRHRASMTTRATGALRRLGRAFRRLGNVVVRFPEEIGGVTFLLIALFLTGWAA